LLTFTPDDLNKKGIVIMFAAPLKRVTHMRPVSDLENLTCNYFF